MSEESIPHLIDVEKADDEKAKKLGLSLGITENGLQLYLTISRPPGLKQIEKYLREIGVRAPLNFEPLKDPEVVEEIITNNRPIVIADLREDALPIHDLEFHESFDGMETSWKKKHLKKEGKTEQCSSLISITSEQKIAGRISFEDLDQTLEIFDVFGNVTEDARRKISIRAGKSVVENDEHELIATSSGYLSFGSGNSINIDDPYRIQSLKDWDQGEKLNYIGSVEIGANVIGNFDIKTGGDIIFRGSTEATRLKSGSKILIKEGIIGQEGANVEARKLVRARYANQADIFCEQDCEFRNGLFHSTVRAHGKVTVEAGAIQGGDVFASYGIIADKLGAPGGVKTRVRVGFSKKIPYSLDNTSLEIEKAVKRLQVLELKVRPLIYKKKKGGMLTEDEMRMLRDSNRLIKLLRDRYRKLSEWLDAHDRERVKLAKINIKGRIYPGVEVEIHNQYKRIDDEMNRVTLYLDMKDYTIKLVSYR